MIYIEHRRNKISDLQSVNKGNGVEIDLRSHVLNAGEMHLSHDAWALGDSFELWLQEFCRNGLQGPIYLNTKEDGLEIRIREVLEKYQISNYLFLDTAFPTLVKNIEAGNGSQFFLRLSKYEDLANSLKFKGLVEWMWVDCFRLEPMSVEIIRKASEYFKLCLVSPELQGGGTQDFSKFNSLVPFLDAICTKYPLAWKDIVE